MIRASKGLMPALSSLLSYSINITHIINIWYIYTFMELHYCVGPNIWTLYLIVTAYSWGLFPLILNYDFLGINNSHLLTLFVHFKSNSSYFIHFLCFSISHSCDWSMCARCASVTIVISRVTFTRQTRPHFAYTRACCHWIY